MIAVEAFAENIERSPDEYNALECAYASQLRNVLACEEILENLNLQYTERARLINATSERLIAALAADGEQRETIVNRHTDINTYHHEQQLLICEFNRITRIVDALVGDPVFRQLYYNGQVDAVIVHLIHISCGFNSKAIPEYLDLIKRVHNLCANLGGRLAPH